MSIESLLKATEEKVKRLPDGKLRLAQDLGIHEQHLQGWISGETKVTYEILAKLEKWVES